MLRFPLLWANPLVDGTDIAQAIEYLMVLGVIFILKSRLSCILETYDILMI